MDKKIIEENSRRFTTCWECKNFWWTFTLRPATLNACIKGKPIPNGEATKNCSEFEAIKK